MSALKPSERSEVSVFNKAAVLGEFLFFFFSNFAACLTSRVGNYGQNDPLLFRYGVFLTLPLERGSFLFFLFTSATFPT